MTIEVSKFMREGGTPYVPGVTMTAAAEAYPPMKQEPGFEVIMAIAALILIIALRRR